MTTIDDAARFAAFNTSIESMRYTPPYNVRAWYPYPPKSDEAMDRLEGYVAGHQGGPGFRVPPLMRPFYRVSDGWLLDWVYDSPSPVDGRPPTGYSRLSGLVDFCLPTDEDEQEAPLYEGYHQFDEAGGGQEVALQFRRGVDEPALYYHEAPSDTYHPLDLDFPTYIDLLLQCRALFPWQQFFITTPGFRIDEPTERAFFDNLARLFPDADPARFRR